MYYTGRNSTTKGTAQIPTFLLSEKIKLFAEERFKDLHIGSVRCRTEKGQIANGILAEIIPTICDVWIDALR